MDKFFQWNNKYHTEITWFIVGLLVQSLIIHLGNGQLLWALVDIAIAGINIYFWKARRV